MNCFVNLVIWRLITCIFFWDSNDIVIIHIYHLLVGHINRIMRRFYAWIMHWVRTLMIPEDVLSTVHYSLALRFLLVAIWNYMCIHSRLIFFWWATVLILVHRSFVVYFEELLHISLEYFGSLLCLLNRLPLLLNYTQHTLLIHCAYPPLESLLEVH